MTIIFGKLCEKHPEREGRRYLMSNGTSTLCDACASESHLRWKLENPMALQRQRTRRRNKMKKATVKAHTNELARKNYAARKERRDKELALGPSLRYNPGTEKPRKGY
jgi:uncharacterized protein with WD repeat